MFDMGMGELLLVGLVVMMLFGPKHMQQLGQHLGQMLGTWRKFLRGVESSAEQFTADTVNPEHMATVKIPVKDDKRP